MPLLLDVNFSDLLLPRYDYVEKLKISKQRTWKMNAMAVHYDLNFGLCMHRMSAEVTTEWIVTADVLNARKPTSSPEDLIAVE